MYIHRNYTIEKTLSKTQTDGECCGFRNPYDYSWPERRVLPISCCKLQNVTCLLKHARRKGCKSFMETIVSYICIVDVKPLIVMW